MSSAGRAANSNGCVSKPKEHATGLIGFAAQIRRSSLIGSWAMETAEHREPCESRGSCTDLGAPGGEIAPGDSPSSSVQRMASSVAIGSERHGKAAVKPSTRDHCTLLRPARLHWLLGKFGPGRRDGTTT